MFLSCCLHSNQKGSFPCSLPSLCHPDAPTSACITADDIVLEKKKKKKKNTQEKPFSPLLQWQANKQTPMPPECRSLPGSIAFCAAGSLAEGEKAAKEMLLPPRLCSLAPVSSCCGPGEERRKSRLDGLGEGNELHQAALSSAAAERACGTQWSLSEEMASTGKR